MDLVGGRFLGQAEVNVVCESTKWPESRSRVRGSVGKFIPHDAHMARGPTKGNSCCNVIECRGEHVPYSSLLTCRRHAPDQLECGLAIGVYKQLFTTSTPLLQRTKYPHQFGFHDVIVFWQPPLPRSVSQASLHSYPRASNSVMVFRSVRVYTNFVRLQLVLSREVVLNFEQFLVLGITYTITYGIG